MSRLTRDLKTLHDDTTYADVVKDCVDRENIVLTKLKHLENVEDILEIDLITLFRALEEGFYYKNKEGHIFYSGNQFIMVGKRFVKTKPCYQVKNITLDSCYYGDVEQFTEVKDAHYWSWATHDQVDLKDYGKTWALTREELEQEEE